jgi:hypothetical protein
MKTPARSTSKKLNQKDWLNTRCGGKRDGLREMEGVVEMANSENQWLFILREKARSV